MLYPLHNLHLILNLLVQHAVLDEAALLKFLGRIGQAVVFGSHLVNHSKRSLSD